MTEALREISFAVDNDRGDPVHGDVRFVENEHPAPVVVFCHGFKGFKDWGPFPTWGRRLARAGFAAVHFNFSYNGVHPEAPTEFTEPEKFAQNTLTRELDDLEAVLDAVDDGDLPIPSIDPGRIGLVGHSRGGGIAILQAARDDRIRSLVTWAAVDGFVERFSDEQIENWRTQGYTEVVNSRTGQVMRLDKVLYEDAVAHENELDVLAAAERIDVPWLIVHARDDESVDVDAAENSSARSESAELMEAEGGHTFGGAHPFDGTVPGSLERVWGASINFFRDHLGT